MYRFTAFFYRFYRYRFFEKKAATTLLFAIDRISVTRNEKSHASLA
jgi:hypothetical protein